MTVNFWNFFSLLQAADGNEPDTYCLSEYFEPIVQKLLETTDRPDAAQANLRAAAYEALMEMVKNSPRDCYITVQKTTMVILERLQQVHRYFKNHTRDWFFLFLIQAIWYSCLK